MGASGFEPLCRIGTVLVNPHEVPDSQNLRLSSRLNGEFLQQCSTIDMIFDV